MAGFSACHKKMHQVPFEMTYYKTGQIDSQSLFDTTRMNTMKIYYYKNGHIAAILHYKGHSDTLDGEQLYFTPNETLEQKLLIANGVRTGNAYYFYEDGNLSASRLFRDNHEVWFGVDYWDNSDNLMKSSLHFNDSGQIYYKKNFDSTGRFINDEGKP